MQNVENRPRAAEEKTTKSLFLFFGENVWSLAKELQRWIREFEKKYENNLDIDIMDGGEKNAAEIQSALESVPFLTDKRLIIIKNFLNSAPAKEQEKIAERLENIPETTVAVFYEEELPDKRTTLFRALKNKGTLKEFTLFSDREFMEWIEQQAIKYHTRLAPETAKKLLEQVGPDLWSLENEIQKLGAYCRNRAVTPQDIELLIAPNLTTSIFKMTDAISQKNVEQAIKIFHLLTENAEPIMTIFAMLARHFRLLLLINDLKKQNYRTNEIYGEMKKYDPKAHPYAISIATGQAQNFKMEELKKIYELLLKLDLDMKTGEIQQETDSDKKSAMLAIEKFILCSTGKFSVR